MNEYYIVWWNLENLFDVENSAQRPEWLKRHLKKELHGWDQEILDKKIQQLSRIIMKMNDGEGPEILGVCEVENEPVLHQLLESLSPLGRNYNIAHHDTSDKRGIDVAFIYDGDKFEFERQFFHIILKRTATRDLFQVNLRCKSSGRDLILIGNHWPSRRGGVFFSEPYRIIAAETLSYWCERIQEEKGKDVAILIMGDFNDEPHNRSVTQYALSTNSIMKVKNSRTPRLYNLMWPLMGRGLGTHYFDNFPCMLDQFLVSRGFIRDNAPIKVKRDSVKVERFSGMMRGTSKIPRRFGRPSSELDTEGFSDHFPISLVLEEV